MLFCKRVRLSCVINAYLLKLKIMIHPLFTVDTAIIYRSYTLFKMFVFLLDLPCIYYCVLHSAYSINSNKQCVQAVDYYLLRFIVPHIASAAYRRAVRGSYLLHKGIHHYLSLQIRLAKTTRCHKAEIVKNFL